jgi:hypothetical protein
MARVDEILSDLQQAKNLRILVLDSCRDNPLADELKRSIGRTRSANVGRGLARMESPNGTIISYATQAGGTAMDGDGRNSPYTSAFLRHIEDKDEVSTVFHRISASVYESTGGEQTPELSLSFFGEYYLNGKLQVTELSLAVATWLARARFVRRRSQPRRSKLDPFKPSITRLLDTHPYSAQQMAPRSPAGNATGGREPSIVPALLRGVGRVGGVAVMGIRRFGPASLPFQR